MSRSASVLRAVVADERYDTRVARSAFVGVRVPRYCTAPLASCWAIAAGKPACCSAPAMPGVRRGASARIAPGNAAAAGTDEAPLRRICRLHAVGTERAAGSAAAVELESLLGRIAARPDVEAGTAHIRRLDQVEEEREIGRR